jgi:hypothetical protein
LRAGLDPWIVVFDENARGAHARAAWREARLKHAKIAGHKK